jgi:hypothetical protein
VAGFGNELSAEETAYQLPASKTAAQFLVAGVRVVGVFLGANTTNKNVRFASSVCARRR